MAKTGAADIERETPFRELHADPPGRGSFLMDNNKKILQIIDAELAAPVKDYTGFRKRRASTWH